MGFLDSLRFLAVWSLFMAEDSETRKESAVVGELTSRFQRYWANIRPRVASWKENYKTVQFYRTLAPRAYKYNYSLPISFVFVENFVASIMNPLFEAPQTVEIVPTEGFSYIYGLGLNDHALARQLERALRFYLDGPDSPFYESYEDMVRMLAYHGTSPAQVLPRFGTESDPEAFAGPSVVPLELWDFVLPPGVRKLERGTECFVREIVTRRELEHRASVRGYRNVKQHYDGIRYEDDIHAQIHLEMGAEGSATQDDEYPDKNARVVLLHHYDSEEHVRIIAGGRTLVFDSRWPVEYQLGDGQTVPLVQKPFPYYPFESVRMGQGPLDFYGIGVAQLTKQGQDSINIHKSQQAQAAEVVLFNPILWNTRHKLDTKRLYTGPGHVIPVQSLDDSLRVLDMGKFPHEVFQMNQEDWMYLEEASGSQKVARGQQPGNRVTATGSTQLLQSSQQRFSMTGTKLARVQARVAMKTLSMIRMFVDQQQYERVIGEPDAGFYSLPLPDIIAGFDFRPKVLTLSASQRSERFNNLMQMIQIAAQIPVFNTPSLIHEMVREMFPDRDPHVFLLPEIIQVAQSLGQIQQMGGQQGIPPADQGDPATQGSDTQYKSPDSIVQASAAGQPV